MIDWRPCRVCGKPVDATRGMHTVCSATLGGLPVVIHDLAGNTVRLSYGTRRALAALIVEGAAYIYQAGVDPLFYNVWLENEIDPESPMGYRGVRRPLANWGTAWAPRNNRP